MTKIRTKLLLIFIFIAGTPLIISSIINIESTRQSIRASVENTLNAIVDYKLLQINEHLETQQAMVLQAAKSPSVFSSLSKMPEAIQQGVESVEYLQLESDLHDYLQVLIETSQFEDVYLVSGEGDVVFSLQHGPELNTNLLDGTLDTSGFADAFSLSTSMFGAKFVGFQPYAAANNSYAAFFSVPIFSGGMLQGALVARFRKDVLFEFAEDYTGLYQSGETMLAKTDINQVLLVAPLRHDNKAAYTRTVSTSDVDPTGIVLAVSGKMGSGTYFDYRSKRVVAAWRYIPKLKWGIVVKLDEVEALAEGQHLVNNLIIEIAISLVVVVFIAIVFAHKLSTPVIRLLGATRNIADGDLDQKLEITSRDELGQLGTSFNEMAQELRHSEERANAAAIAKTQFLSTMSHEIRTPMNGVLGTVQLLEDTGLSDEQREYVSTINSCGNNLLVIINDILDFSKLGSVAVELESIPFNLESLGQECLELVLPNALENGVELVLDYQPGMPYFFYGDPSRLRQVILNLVGNAIKFTKDGIVCFRVRCESNEAGSYMITIDVEDSGIGIEPDKLDRLFDEFSQADQSTSRQFGGTGLGLAISKKIVELMQGQITAKSNWGEGSRFRMQISLQESESPEAIPQVDLKGKRVLVVGERDANRRVMQRLLEYYGIESLDWDFSEDIVDKLSKVHSRKGIDIVMVFQGADTEAKLSFGKNLSKQRDLQDVKLMLLATVGFRGDRVEFEAAGYDAYLSLPCSRDGLRCMLESLLQNHQSGQMLTHYSVQDIPKSELKDERFCGHILLVEDVLANQMIAHKMLSSLGFEVDIANDGQEAIDLFEAQSYNLIFMDCLMPNVDGYQATEVIRERETSKQRLPIVALTANASVEDQDRCRQAGMDGVVTKPFRKSDLIACVSLYFEPV